MGNLSSGDIVLIVIFVVAAVLAALYFFSRKNYGKMLEAQNLMEQNKMVTQIYVIDKKFEKPSEQNLGKAIFSKLPKTSRIRKMPIVKAKVGPQIVTLITDKTVYDVLPVKKTIKVTLSGLYIMSVAGIDLSHKKKKTLKEKFILFTKSGNK